MSSQLGRKSPHVCFIQKALASRSLLKRHESYYSKEFLIHLCKCELILLSKWHLFLRSQWLILCVMNCPFIGQTFPYIVKMYTIRYMKESMRDVRNFFFHFCARFSRLFLCFRKIGNYYEMVLNVFIHNT